MQIPKELQEFIYEALDSFKSEQKKLEKQCETAQNVFTETKTLLDKIIKKRKEYEQFLKDLNLPQQTQVDGKSVVIKEWDGEIPARFNSDRMQDLAGLKGN